MAAKLYEAMFVIDAAKSGSQFPGAIQHIASLLTRHGAEIDRIEKWDERKLAYPIRGVKRGIYVLTYFRTEGATIAELRRDIALSEEILRVLIVVPDAMASVQGQLYNADGEEIERPEPAPAETDAEADAETDAEADADGDDEDGQDDEPEDEEEDNDEDDD